MVLDVTSERQLAKTAMLSVEITVTCPESCNMSDQCWIFWRAVAQEKCWSSTQKEVVFKIGYPFNVLHEYIVTGGTP